MGGGAVWLTGRGGGRGDLADCSSSLFRMAAPPSELSHPLGHLLNPLAAPSGERADEKREALNELLKLAREQAPALWGGGFPVLVSTLIENVGDQEVGLRFVVLVFFSPVHSFSPASLCSSKSRLFAVCSLFSCLPWLLSCLSRPCDTKQILVRREAGCGWAGRGGAELRGMGAEFRQLLWSIACFMNPLTVGSLGTQIVQVSTKCRRGNKSISEGGILVLLLLLLL